MEVVMVGKKTMVMLECPKHNIKREFEVIHAENILRLRNTGGWQLPADSQFEFNKEYGIRVKRNKKTDPDARKGEND